MKFLNTRSILASLIFACVAGIPSYVWVGEDPSHFSFEVSMAADTGGTGQVFFNNGQGYREQLSARVPLINSSELRVYRFPIPTGSYESFRFDPINTASKLQVGAPRIVDGHGKVLREFELDDMIANDQIANSVRLDNFLHLTISPEKPDPWFILNFADKLELKLPWYAHWVGLLKMALPVFLLLVGALYGIERFVASPSRVDRTRQWITSRPKTVVAGAALIGAVLSTYPVVFFGKSFVSPNYIDGTYLLYQGFPTLPGYDDDATEHVIGSDVGAMAWHHHPLSIIEHRALFRDGELPLWNRYNSTGSVLLGQGQSMFGDPLHVLPILANGAAWAWDLKYLLAKWLFACVLGLIVLVSTRHLPSALLTAATATFIGFFIYRVNHPAIFSLSYSPLILYGWLILLKARNFRTSALPALLLVFANWMVLTSGTAKEAYMLMLGLNFTGCIIVALAELHWGKKLQKVAIAAGAGVLLLIAASPIWFTFYEALSQGYSVYDTPFAYQINPSFLIGLFDEVFYRCVQVGERVFNPSTNFLVLLGVLIFLATFRQTPADRLKIALSAAALVPLSFAFGLVPPEWIVKIPFVANVAHIDNCFSLILIVHLLAIAGYGYKIALERLGTREGLSDIWTSMALLGLLIFPWVAIVHTVHRPSFGLESIFSPLRWGQHLPVSDFAWGSLIILPATLIALLFVVRYVARKGEWTGAAIVLALLCVSVLLWRQGQHLTTGFATYTYNPPVRVDFHAKSEAVTYMQKASAQPYRVVGFDGNLTPGWSAAYDLETIAGPEAVVNAHFREVILATGLMPTWSWRLYTYVSAIPEKRKAYDFLNVRYFLKATGSEDELPGGLKRGLKADLDVFESNTAWPRAFFTDRLTTYDHLPELANLILTGDGTPFAAGQLSDAVQLPNLPRELAGRTVVPADNYKLTINTTSFEVKAPGTGLVVLHEAFLPGSFRVRINGQPTDYFRINHVFKGVTIPAAGTYRISFNYWPPHLMTCLVLSALAFAGIGGLAWAAWRVSGSEN